MAEEKLTVLIAEDEEDLREMYVTAFSNKGINVLQAKNGEEVFEWLEKNHAEIALLVLDIVMPEMDGFEVLKKIKKEEKYNGIKVLVSTNLDNDDDRKEAQDLGADDYFVKSQHDPSELVEKVLEICKA